MSRRQRTEYGFFGNSDGGAFSIEEMIQNGVSTNLVKQRLRNVALSGSQGAVIQWLKRAVLNDNGSLKTGSIFNKDELVVLADTIHNEWGNRSGRNLVSGFLRYKLSLSEGAGSSSESEGSSTGSQEDFSDLENDERNGENRLGL